MVRQGKYTRVTPVRRAKRATRRQWRWWKEMSRKKKIMVIVAPILAFLILTPLLTYGFYYNDIADQERLMNRNNTGIVLNDRNGETIYSTGRAQHRDIVKLADISPELKDALIASEDKDFYKHKGFSIDGILRAFYGTVTSQEAYGGGSTLTQQLAKNTLLSADRSFLRKYQELAISIAIEQRYSKDEILEMYLNSTFFGGTTFGIEDAAKVYYNKSPKDLGLAESAMLIGILPAPNAYSPTTGNPEYAKERQTTVLTRMVLNGYITEAEKQAALGQILVYAPVQEDSQGEAPHFAQMVLEELYKKYGEEKVIRSGYQVQTTLDMGLQRKLAANIAGHIGFIQRNGGSNAGGIAVDPTSGEVRALVGSADWNNPDWGKVNMATTARQPGSSFKPIYYAEALADGVITPATIIKDEATDFGGYSPKNANRGYSGNISVRNALARSLNIPAVKVMQKLGVETSIEAANRMGISAVKKDGDYGLPLALGTAEAPLIQMTNAYAAFANQGQQYPTATIKQIDDKFDKTIFRTSEKSKQVISPEGAYLISSILSDNAARAPIFGSSLTVAGRTAAVKTGTTDEQRDAWTIGYTPQMAVGVWVGNNFNEAMLNGGSGMAGPIWVKTMRQALEGVPNTQFTIPGGIIQKAVCIGSGALANSSGPNTYNEYFLASALPTELCNAAQKEPEKPAEKPKEEESDTSQDEDEDTSGNGSNNGTTDPNTDNGSDDEDTDAPNNGTNQGGGVQLPNPTNR
jgi:1A family penicillin-binding protein